MLPMDLSYAQNLEDYHLAQAFAGQERGFYIDVGAGHPVADNVSCWFYLSGWRGIVVEPQADLLAMYAHVRPRDIRENRLVGRAAGRVDFHLVDRLHGFSTIVPEHAAKAVEIGASFSTRQHEMTTLAALCAEHRVGRIDFLKIDVEGAEGDVLAGHDFARFRPRVICLEAVVPGDMSEGWHLWEPLLVQAGYEFVLYERLNRFYVAREEAQLLARFPRQPAPWLVVPHLGHTNRAERREDHPDHAFARRLTDAFLAGLPGMDRAALLTLVRRGTEQADLDAPLTSASKAAAIAALFPGKSFAHASAGLMALEAPTLAAFQEKLVDSDPFRVMLGRISMSYDGGQILD